MVEENEANQDARETDNSQNNSNPLGYLQGVCVTAFWVFIALLLVAIFWPNLTERTKFFTGNLFNLVIAFAVIAQVLIYRKQWLVMERQWKEANRQAESSAKLIELMVAKRASLYAYRKLEAAKILQ